MGQIECGHPGIFLVDVESKSFPDVVKVVQKLESSRAQIEGVRCDTVYPSRPKSTTRPFDRGACLWQHAHVTSTAQLQFRAAAAARGLLCP